MTVAFFDLDHTLLTVNSGNLWVRYQYRQGLLSKADLVRTMGYLVGYRFALVDVERVAKVAVSRIRGQSEDAMRRDVHGWYEREVRPHMDPEVVAVARDHKAQGHKLVLLTASSPYISEKVCEELAFDDFLCTRFGVENGVFTGELEGPMCYGPGKVVYGTRWLERHGHDGENAWFYTDSYTDLPMLLAVGHPVAVKPDPRLGRWARQNNVPILAPQ
ncbi:MAG: HAD family hydrolase [bacterium]